MNHDTAALWARFEDTPADMGLLRIIADHYRDEGNDEYADCLQWCAENGRMPSINCNGCLSWYPLRTNLWHKSSFTHYLPDQWEKHFFWNESRNLTDRRMYFGDEISTRTDAYLLLCRNWYAVMGPG